MDPLTAALQLANTIASMMQMTIAALPPEQRAEYAKLQLAELQHWRDFCDSLRGKVG